MKQRKICSTCLQASAPQSLVCSNCGQSFQFDVRTPVVALELRNQLATQEAVQSLHNLPPNNIALYVISDPNPILIPYQTQLRIILGRDMSNGDFVGINLSNHHA